MSSNKSATKGAKPGAKVASHNTQRQLARQQQGEDSTTSQDITDSIQQIKVPEAFPEILKQFTKAAIRTQPADLLAWSAAYFRAMANGEQPPVKDRLELPPLRNSASGLTPGLLKILHNQLQNCAEVDTEDLATWWVTLGLDRKEMDALLQAGGLAQKFPWRKFAALAASSMAKDLNDTMVIICELMTSEPPGGAASVPFSLFQEMYTFLSYLDPEVNRDHTEACLKYLEQVAAKNICMITPTDLDHPDCPRLT